MTGWLARSLLPSTRLDGLFPQGLLEEESMNTRVIGCIAYVQSTAITTSPISEKREDNNKCSNLLSGGSDVEGHRLRSSSIFVANKKLAGRVARIGSLKPAIPTVNSTEHQPPIMPIL
jgi:hypothetical protein